ncbi:MAG: sensor histidine kinase N-terminal domain-containing protein [Azonexus sp.]|jgi:two-component system sensor histidine kinase QseC|nr:sensor histidine kinase N-terminal domain-containing protein [Azonexus sp.]
MTARRVLSLTQRLTLMTVTFVVVVWAVTAVATWRNMKHDLDELLDAHLAQTAALLIASDLEDEDDETGGGVIQAPILIDKYQSRVAFQIWRHGQLRARSSDAPDVPLAAAGSSGLANTTVNGLAWRVFTVAPPGRVDDIVHVGEHVSAREDILAANMCGQLVLLLALPPLLIAGIIWMVRRAVRPLTALGRHVAQRQPRDLDLLPEDNALPEARPLVVALNGLFARMAEQLASEQRFTADAAHELRTPIAAIRIQAQVAQGASNEAERAAALAATIIGCDRATRLVEQLMQLARLETEATAADGGKVDLTAIAADCLALLQPQAATRGQQIDWQSPGGAVPVAMSAALAAGLLRNLVDNALRYSPDGARVCLQITPAEGGQGACFTVEDSGPGLPPDVMGRLGELFLRQLGTRQNGSGLGWAIVRRIAQRYGLASDIDRSPTLGGLRVRITWPPAAPD